jgi:hypothetical protein
MLVNGRLGSAFNGFNDFDFLRKEAVTTFSCLLTFSCLSFSFGTLRNGGL